MLYTHGERAKPCILEYGWAIFLISRNKVPLVKGGCQAATTMQDRIDEWTSGECRNRLR